ncbi:39 kDa initiator binding protein [Histomonas meleagridis]|uniref:39 kDa initiator binding protein n=1 Tax=Histomonas meleagridis TaxID=135588 RepID=UPI0035594119|nr:39 kDa initiator binding protein [Histomonas meleagridis]KAH0803513.1 39 kDa initiator binding protein [Histomonas meleagridis]
MEDKGFDDLPPEIQKVIERKSSRDPASRFSNKLLILLNYAGDDETKQNFVGAGWVDKKHFRINKKRLVVIMKIKINTLNVNLKDLKFHQIQNDQNGWTTWERAGFAQESTAVDLADEKIMNEDKTNFPNYTNSESPKSKISLLREINLGMTSANTIQSFKSIIISIWEEFTANSTNRNSIATPEFLEMAAKRFRASHQKLANSKVVLETIFKCFDPNQITVTDFARFIAKFGPEATLMQKIASLLKSSNENQNWLKIVHDPYAISSEGESIYGFFDESEDNCFVIIRNDRTVSKVYNMVEEPASGEYLIDSSGTKYTSWQNYFEVHPSM